MCKFFYEVGSAFEGVLVCQCVYEFGKILISMRGGGGCCVPLREKCPKHHAHKGDPGVTPGSCGTVSEGPKCS